MKKMALDYIKQRLNELHGEVFGEKMPKIHVAMSYFGWNRLFNKLGFGTDYSDHPRNPFTHFENYENSVPKM